MTKWAMVADSRRCGGCQTCTASCKQTNATPPGVQWRRVLDMEVGDYPDVRRAFVPVGCMHCDDPPCMHVCPSTATRKRADGIVTIDYDLCIGCAYCAVACPYQARYKSAEDAKRPNVATKCTFCVERIDAGLAKGPEARRGPGGDAGLRQFLHRQGAALRRRGGRHEQHLGAARRVPSPRSTRPGAWPGCARGLPFGV